ncbi:ATP-binding protein [Calothrix sp. NIES-2098]|uniref:ATP-binding protein n=1 Tax=Calothrix sp. NIES-2098 TaxID=1954171 RepID=UPI000B5DF356|nr:putative anti-sigma regulatory factor serine/threonine protein kinase [Calothrix sp. NIES-2098]
MANRFFLQTNTDITVLSQVLSWFEQINQPPLINKEIWWQCQTLIIEGFTNIVEHAHKNLSVQTPINIEVFRSHESIEIRIFSQGKPFNLEQKLQEVSEFEENDRERGRGLKIMSKLADNLSYEQIAENRYCLFMSKFY